MSDKMESGFYRTRNGGKAYVEYVGLVLYGYWAPDMYHYIGYPLPQMWMQNHNRTFGDALAVPCDGSVGKRCPNGSDLIAPWNELDQKLFESEISLSPEQMDRLKAIISRKKQEAAHE